MHKVNSKSNNNIKRRKDLMLQNSLSKMKYLLVLAVLLVLPILPTQAIAGQELPLFGFVDLTDTGENRLIAYWDTRGRDTFIQVTNTTSSKINIHINIFDVAHGEQVCQPCDFNDMLTPNDTHVYNMEDIRNNITGNTECEGVGINSYGFMAVSVVQVSEDFVNRGGPLVGVFRIIDELGYEYRTNAAGKIVFCDGPCLLEVGSFVDLFVNFSSANGNVLSDLVGITFAEISGSNVLAAPGISTTFGINIVDEEILIYSQDETSSSCGETTFTCDLGKMNKGIDNSLPNSIDGSSICPVRTLDDTTFSGWLHLPFNNFSCVGTAIDDGDGNCILPIFFTGFLGLNNGDGTGSMDSWWLTENLDPIHD